MFRRWLYIVHRWMGIAGCLLIAMWFGSGVVMMYVGFPALTHDERLAGLPPIDMAGIAIAPAEAMAAAGLTTFPRSLTLEMAGDVAVYRMVDVDGRPHAVSAYDARAIGPVDAQTAAAIAARFARRHTRWLGLVERDQWTVHPGLDPWRPLHRIAVDDGRGTQLYVSARTGEVMRDTDRGERMWNWLGAVPHWLYFTPIRRDTALWRGVVLWVSGACVLVAVSGIWVGVLRVRVRKRFAHGSARGMSPYRGWMAWHHMAGLAGALFLLAWLVSGWLSVNPNRWFDTGGFGARDLQRYGGHEAPTFPAPAWSALAGDAARCRQIAMVWVGGRPALQLSTEDARRIVDPATGQAIRWTTRELVAAATALVPGSAVAGTALQRDEDRYWYSHRQIRTLPVLRVRFADEHGTTAYIDPQSGEVVGRAVNSRRIYRWLFHAMHSWDLSWLLLHRPAWDIWVCCLSLIGLAMSVSGAVIGWRRLRRPRSSR